MTENTLFNNGLRWLKADFHLHTRSDKEFKYFQSENDIKNGYPEENTFPNDYIAKLKSENISVGIITNHNKFNEKEFLALQKKARKENIFLLPGIELSINEGSNGVHTIIVFSEAWISDGCINGFLNSAFQGQSPKDYENENGRTTKSLLDIIKDLSTFNKDYFIIFAHVEQNNGLWKALEGGKIHDLSKDVYSELRKHVLGFQKVRTNDKRQKVKEWLKPWYPAEVEGSDCKSLDEIGSKNGESWIKIGEFSFAAVKYALTDYEERVRNSVPEKCRHSYIKSIEFEGGLLSGKKINFSPELNTFIGIRGSGKSSILEVLRFGLNLELQKDTADIEYKKNLVTNILGTGTNLKITAVDKFGQEYIIRRRGVDLPEVYVDDILKPGISINQTVIKNPLYFGQKELSANSENFGTDLIERLVGNKLADIRQKIKQQESIVQSLVFSLGKMADSVERIKEYEKKQNDIKFNLKVFSDKGIEEKLKTQTEFDKDSNWFNSTENIIEESKNSLTALLEEFVGKINERETYGSTCNSKEIELAKGSLKNIKKVLDEINGNIARISAEIKNFNGIISSFNEKKDRYENEFVKIRRELETQLRSEGENILDIANFKELNIKLTQTEEMLNALKKQQATSLIKKKDLFFELEKLNALHFQEFKLIEEELMKINSGETSLSIKCEFKGDKQSFLKFMKSEFTGSRIREETYKELVEQYQDFSDLYEDLDQFLYEDAQMKWKKIIPDSLVQNFKETFSKIESQLLTYRVPDKITIEYQGKNLQQHSLGQRASALILFILSRKDNDVIIIDQPEDDLDNQTIYNDVIKLIKKVKPEMQCIFATHNANIPVLGDAEMVHACFFKDNSIDIRSGNIDMAETQNQIVNIMEGGKEAFEKRKGIYLAWKL